MDRDCSDTIGPPRKLSICPKEISRHTSGTNGEPNGLIRTKLGFKMGQYVVILSGGEEWSSYLEGNMGTMYTINFPNTVG